MIAAIDKYTEEVLSVMAATCLAPLQNFILL
jgi:hypothetical protein